MKFHDYNRDVIKKNKIMHKDCWVLRHLYPYITNFVNSPIFFEHFQVFDLKPDTKIHPCVSKNAMHRISCLV